MALPPFFPCGHCHLRTEFLYPKPILGDILMIMAEVDSTQSTTAFISYSHKDSIRSKGLHESLENYKGDARLVGQQTGTGVVASNLRPDFKIRADLYAGTGLESQTVEALGNSNSGIVVCSPKSARSDHVRPVGIAKKP